MKLAVLLPLNVRQGQGSVVELLGAMAAALRDAAERKVKAEGQPESNTAVQEKLMAAQAIRECQAKIRSESSELWRKFHEDRKKNPTPGDPCPKPESPPTTGSEPGKS